MKEIQELLQSGTARMTNGSSGSQIPISSIAVGERYRKDLGDLKSLMMSIQDIGLLHPVVVNAELVLIAGARRLEACKQLGWTDIPVHILDLEDLLRAEHDENVVRKDFLPSEAVAIKKALEPLERERARERQSMAGRTCGKGMITGEKFAPPIKGKVRERVAASAGMSHTSLTKAEEIVAAAAREPGKYLDLVSEMDRTGRIDGVYRKLKILTQSEQLAKEPPPLPTGPFRVIVADPPWQYEKRANDPSRRGMITYPSMSLEQIQSLDVKGLSANDSILWLWTTNAHLPSAFNVVNAWGFEYKTTLTWIKNKMGTGDWLRGQSEHCLLCVRGKPVVNLTNQTTIICGPVRSHSTKPDEFYEMVESLCPGAKVELFARKKRAGWQSHGTFR